jgi:ABC-type bacteriocin/lantibiotic exporter with double-glycine peptidase domain
MKLPPDLEAKGLLAYEQAGAFESLQRRQLPLISTGLTLLMLLCGLVLLKLHEALLAGVTLGGAVLFPILAWRKWQRLRVQHAENLRLLAELQAQYGDLLPWIQVEKHFAALEQLQRELAEEKRERERGET